MSNGAVKRALLCKSFGEIISLRKQEFRVLTISKTHVRIPRREWERLRRNPRFGELIELLEDRADLEAAKRVRGRDMTLNEYIAKRGLRNHR